MLLRAGGRAILASKEVLAWAGNRTKIVRRSARPILKRRSRLAVYAVAAGLGASTACRQCLSPAPPMCRGCEHEHTCGGGCGAASEWVLGHARRFPHPLIQQYLDDDFAEQLAEARQVPRRLALYPA